MRTFHSRLAPFVGAVLLTSLSGCGGAASGTEAQGRIDPDYDKTTGRLTRLAYDSNGNGKHDTWAFMDGARLTRLEADENEDGKIDRWEYYPSGAAGQLKQPPERIERATRLDGRVSRREFFEAGEMVRVEEDTDGNGTTDKWETYAGGGLVTLALDTGGHGKPDRRLIYRPDGSLDRIETDPTGSGEFRSAK
ncbi:MAG TPA: hypothetical protein VJ813_15005 [Vicinamibacterales bacterium]|nr:hypothetical protein [Vicinamibacterales bacterium]